MNGRRAIVALCMLCALLVSAFAAQSASAITGTTAFTCVKGKGTFRGEHCLSAGGAAAEYGHVEVAQDKTTETTTTNAKSANETNVTRIMKIRMNIAEEPFELQVTGVSGSGWIENKKAVSGEHYVHGKGSITFTGVTVTEPVGKGCRVTTHKEDGSGSPGEEGEEGIIHTRELTTTTEGQGNLVKLRAADNGPVANFWITCEIKKVPAIEGTWTITGSVQGVSNGATVNFTHSETTTQNKLFARGAKVGFDGGLTLSGREKGSAGAYAPLATTNVETEPPPSTGTTAFTCVKGQGSLIGEHCLSTGFAAPEYGHVAIPESTTTELTGTNAKTKNETTEGSTGRLKTTVGGVPVELQATGVSGSGWMENKLTASGEHYVHGKGTLTVTGVSVLQPAGRGCKATTDNEEAKEEGEVGVVHTRELTATTEGQGDFLKFEAADKGNLASFFVTCEPGKRIEAIEGTWSCSGSAKSVPAGATATFIHSETTTQNTLKCRGSKSGIEGNLTLSGREKGSTGVYTPVAATTYTT
ncbi:MAG TPA: hypothetical protein VF081_07715 [Solirubrobacterales bacterium]